MDMCVFYPNRRGKQKKTANLEGHMCLIINRQSSITVITLVNEKMSDLVPPLLSTVVSLRRIYVLREWWTLPTYAGSWRTSPRTGTDWQRWKWHKGLARTGSRVRGRRSQSARLQGQRLDFVIRLIDAVTWRKCSAAQSAIFIPSPGVPIKQGIWFEWKVFGYWHLNTYWLNNDGLVGFTLKAFFFLSMKTAAFRGGKHEPFTIVPSAGSCPLLRYYRFGFCDCKDHVIKLCKAQNP